VLEREADDGLRYLKKPTCAMKSHGEAARMLRTFFGYRRGNGKRTAISRKRGDFIGEFVDGANVGGNGAVLDCLGSGTD